MFGVFTAGAGTAQESRMGLWDSRHALRRSRHLFAQRFSCAGVGWLTLRLGIWCQRTAFPSSAAGRHLCGTSFGIRSTPVYQRLQSIVFGSVQGDLDRGSAEARKELLRLSVHLMITHPLVGIGPGNFPAVTGTWRVAHNTYSELGAEAGIPALLLFLLVMASVYRNLRVVQKTARFKKDPEFRLFAGALVASFGAYLMGAFFSDTAYELFPYFLVAYTVALRRIAISSSEKPIPQSTNRLKVSQPI